MTPFFTPSRTALLAVAFLASAAVHATEPKPIPTPGPASGPDSHPTVKFDTRSNVTATLTLHKGHPIKDGYEAQFRFARQSDYTPCVFHLPKASQTVQHGETATGTIKCSKAWQVYDDGMSFEAFEGGRKVGEGTLRP